ncbi:MAG: signal peptidase II [Christensenellales bacterium]
MIKKLGVKKLIAELGLLIAVLVIDLLSKSLVFAFLADKKSGRFELIEGIFALQEAHNYGASFGIFEGKQTMLVVLTAVVMVALSVLLVVKPKLPTLARSGIILIIGGGVGNLVDRIVYGYVRDFIDYTFLDTFFGIDFAIGNIADIFLLVGTFMVIIYVIFQAKEEDFFKPKQAKISNETSQDEVGGE